MNFSYDLFIISMKNKGGYMGKNLGEILNNIMKENSTKRVAVLTDNLYITGVIHDYHENCKNCHDCLIALKDVRIARIKALEKCRQRDDMCSEDIFIDFKWFNISSDSIVGFSILGMDE
jgi:hypothetical protein